MCKQTLRPYIRRASGRERSNDLRVAFKLAYHAQLNRPYYVMVQRGYPLLVIAVGRSRREVEQSVMTVRCGIKTFRQWSSDVRRYATKQR